MSKTTDLGVIEELGYWVELNTKMTKMCCDKCIGKNYKDPDLNLGEMACIDRCVSKYKQVNAIIGQILSTPRRD